MRMLVVPDSFKGSLSAIEVCEIVGDVLRAAGHDTVLIPVADGGEGTIDAMRIAAGCRVAVDNVHGPLGGTVEAARGRFPDGRALIELAQSAGLGLVGADLRVADATTYGVGEQILAAVEAGAEEIVVAIGGSATNDGGCGLAAACGVRFLNNGGKEFVPIGGTLCEISSVDVSGLRTNARIVAMCDVDNPLTGEHGAAAVFGPQKGADSAAVTMLDEGLRHLAKVIRRDLGIDVEHIPGAGAAGGVGAGLVAFFGAELRSGIDVVLDAANFDEHLLTADVVITGEGSFDSQSLRGKVIHGVATRAKRAGVPVHVLAGRVEPGLDLRTAGISSATAITPEQMPLAEAIAQAPALLRAAAEALGRRVM